MDRFKAARFHLILYNQILNILIMTFSSISQMVYDTTEEPARYLPLSESGLPFSIARIITEREMGDLLTPVTLKIFRFNFIFSILFH